MAAARRRPHRRAKLEVLHSLGRQTADSIACYAREAFLERHQPHTQAGHARLSGMKFARITESYRDCRFAATGSTMRDARWPDVNTRCVAIKKSSALAS